VGLGPDRAGLSARAGSGLGYVLAAVPVFATFWYVWRYGVNVPFEDSWNGTLPSVKAIVSGHVSLALLNAPHNENRMLFPNLIQGLLDSHTQANATVDMYLSAGIMTAALVLLIYLARRTLELHPLYLVPVAFLLFDWVQVENLLWAFQFAWMLISCSLILALVGLERRGQWAWFLLACIAALIGSFSSLQGLLIWPVGLLYAGLAGWNRRWLAAWTGLGLAAVVIYLRGFGDLGTSSGLQYDAHHPLDTLLYLVRLVGGIVPTHHHTLGGVLIIGLGGVVAWIAIRTHVPLRLLRLPLALSSMGVAFDLLVATGRTQLAVPDDSRYTTYNLLLAAGIVLTAMAILNASPVLSWMSIRSRLHAHPVAALMTLLSVAVILAVISLSVPNGLATGQQYRSSRVHGAQILRNYQTSSDAELRAALFAPSGAYVKVWAAWLRAKRWSVFS
jgi:hypothetical protein